MITLGTLALWIMEHRRGKAFRGYDINKIVLELDDCADTGGLLCISDNYGISGVICFKTDPDNKTLFVYDILTIKSGVVWKMLKEFHRRYKGYRIEGTGRNGRKILFTDTHKLEQKLSYG